MEHRATKASKLQSESERDTNTSIKFIWIPSHIDISGNDSADELAKKGTYMDQTEIPVIDKIIRSKIKARKWEITHERARAIYTTRRCPKMDVEKLWPRDVRRCFQQLRTGHSKFLKNYRYIIDLEDDPFCDCEMNEEETTEHILCRCPALTAQRQRHFEGEVDVTMMSTEPETCRKFLESRIPQLRMRNALISGGPNCEVAPPLQDIGESRQ